jgi:hypothetical protein
MKGGYDARKNVYEVVCIVNDSSAAAFFYIRGKKREKFDW